MIRQRCSAVFDHQQCKRVYRTRKPIQFCREHYRTLYSVSRPIESREVIHGANRRTRNRRSVSVTKQVPKVIANRNNRNKNAQQT
jgi:hypothetical protein